MQTTPYTKLKELKGVIESRVSNDAAEADLWESLGWDQAFDGAYEHVRTQAGVDLKSLIAPNVADIVSIVDEGALNFPYPAHSYSWDDILAGAYPEFHGQTPKERMLAVIDASLQRCGN